MGLLDRLRAWWRRRFGGGAVAAVDYECAVCGTEVADPAETCPLCRSSDVVPVGGPADADGGDDDGGAATGAVTGRRVATGDDDAVSRLAELRADGEVLERHADRWRAVDGGYRVETSDGTVAVDSREEVVALLRAEDG